MGNEEWLRTAPATCTSGISERRCTDTTFLHSGLKNSGVQSSTAQSVVASRVYDAFGNVTASAGAWQGPFGYGGGFGYQSEATELKLLGHRYYDPSTGRFLTRDPIKDGRNWYAYCGNDPVGRADPTGLEWHDPLSIYVHPDFEGQVIVVGEPGPGMTHVHAIVPPGQSSSEKMDVDYVIISHPDGRTDVRFLPGLAPPWGDEEYQQGEVDAEGRIHAPGPNLGTGDVPYLGRLFLGLTGARLGEWFDDVWNGHLNHGLDHHAGPAEKPKGWRGKDEAQLDWEWDPWS